MLRHAMILVMVAMASGELMPWLNPLTPHGKIVGGEAAEIEEVPYQVSLQVQGFSFCGGCIVSRYWVVSAGHCMVYPVDWVTIRAGSARMSTGGSLHNVESTVRHEDYRTNKYGIPENDIALLKIKTPFEFDVTRQPVPLFYHNEVSNAGATSLITGWGARWEGGSTSEYLQKVFVPIVHKNECNDAYKSYGGVPAGQICAAYPEGGKDACQGDSGGPLTIDGRLAGIVSWGNGCARQGYPGVYTEVAAYREWVDKHLNDFA